MAPPLDTNLIIRYLTRDNPDQSQRAYQFFRQLGTGTEVARLAEGVLVEAVQVLSSKALYNLPRQTIRRRLKGNVRLRGVQLYPKRRYLRALDLYATTNLDFVDAVLVVMAERSRRRAVISFDRDYDRLPNIIRKEPDTNGSVS
jgi:predicted nucleic-acid-binding protein